MNSTLSYILLPFSWLYGLIGGIRNSLYSSGVFASKQFEVPVVCVGNLAVGGTGKTPMIEYLIELLNPHYQIAVISRGYKRKSTGYLEVEIDSNTQMSGDEAAQVKQKFPTTVVVVCEDRAVGIQRLLTAHPTINLVLMDDGFQHRAVKPSVAILLSDYSRPFFKDFVLPAGRLREFRRGSLRADSLIFTKCPPDFIPYKLDTNQPVFYSSIAYAPLTIEGDVVGFSGLANNAIFEKYLSNNYQLKEFFAFDDHHHFSSADIEKLKIASREASLVCTEKDAVKLQNAGLENLQVIKIHSQFDDESFDNWIKRKLKHEG